MTETSVVGHGPAGAELAHRIAEKIRARDERFLRRDVRFEIPRYGRRLPPDRPHPE